MGAEDAVEEGLDGVERGGDERRWWGWDLGAGFAPPWAVGSGFGVGGQEGVGVWGVGCSRVGRWWGTMR